MAVDNSEERNAKGPALVPKPALRRCAAEASLASGRTAVAALERSEEPTWREDLLLYSLDSGRSAVAVVPTCRELPLREELVVHPFAAGGCAAVAAVLRCGAGVEAGLGRVLLMPVSLNSEAGW